MSLTDCLVHTQDQASGLNGSLDGVDLNQTGLPHESNHVITDTLVVKVDTGPDVALAVLHTQAVQNIGGIEAGVVAELAGDNLKSLGKGLDNGLLLVRHVAVGEAVQVAGQFHLSGTSTSNDSGVAEGTLDDHNGVVQTALHLGNKLLSTSAQDESAGLGGRALGEEVEALSTDLTLLEDTASTQVALLDVTAGRLGGSAGSLANTVHVVGRNTAGTEDVTVRKVPASENVSTCILILQSHSMRKHTE